jgi:hypothetical protein
MDNEDWHHMDDYWRAMYGDVYPHEKETDRGGTITDADLEPGQYAHPRGKVRILNRSWYVEDKEPRKRAA